MGGFHYEKDADGIVTVTMDLTGPVNTMSPEYETAMAETVERLEKEPHLAGVVFASAKKTFFAGGDLQQLLDMPPGTEEAIFRNLEVAKSYLRRLEKLQAPVVAVINGAALGGGLEICLACNRRIIVADKAAIVGLPEVTLGLLPGAGGVVRLVNLLGLQKAVPLLLEGTRLRPQAALAAGIVDEIVADTAALIPAAKAWIKANPTAWQQPWDKAGHKIPGGNARDPQMAQFIGEASAALRKQTRGLLPAPERILSVAVEAATVDIDTALRIETRGFAELVTTPEAKNLINTMFFHMNEVRGGANRPKDIPKCATARLGVLGAGMMGQGIAYVAAKAGIEVILRDVDLATAQKGKGYSETLTARAVAKGAMTQAQAEALLARIKPTTEMADLAGCDLIIEAVFEKIDVKDAVVRDAEPYLAAGGVFGSNTSTLPIGRLAQSSRQPENFIGIHFFSPVDRMPLVELICGRKTSDGALAKAYDFVRQIGKTAIVVNDSLWFFTSRVFASFMDEGARLLMDGVDPVLIDDMGRQVGMPVGPLAVQDEVSQKLTKFAADTHKEMGVYGTKVDTSASIEIATRLIGEYGRGGRQHGGGYYEYPADGQKHIWPKLYDLFHRPDVSLSEADIKDRILFRQVIESIKCLEENVLRSVADGNVGSVLGIGAPTWTGGFLQFVNTYGLQKFVQRTSQLAERYGDRFRPPQLLLIKAQRGEAFR